MLSIFQLGHAASSVLDACPEEVWKDASLARKPIPDSAWRAAGKCCRSGGLGLPSAQTPGKIRKVELLTYKGELKWKQDEASLKVEMPGEKISDVGITLKVELA
jgi:hypothetical protein